MAAHISPPLLQYSHMQTVLPFFLFKKIYFYLNVNYQLILIACFLKCDDMEISIYISDGGKQGNMSVKLCSGLDIRDWINKAIVNN